jgi:acetone carboxylase gamma subunit
MAVFTEGGRGRKQCPSCNQFVGVRISKCDCGHVFSAKDKAEKAEKTKVSDEPKEVRRGRKQCPGCKQFVGLRIAKCECGYEFSEKDKVEKIIEPKEVRRYAEAGRGRKQCPGCNQFVGLRVTKCECGHEFPVKSDNDQKEIQHYTEAGRGRKQCPGCNHFIGAKVSKCDCGHDFQKKVESTLPPLPPLPAKSLAAVRTKFSGYRLRYVDVPAGECPVKLGGTDRDSVATWRSKLIDSGIEKNMMYTAQAVRYFARYCCGLDDEDRKTVVSLLEEIAEEEIAEEEEYSGAAFQ